MINLPVSGTASANFTLANGVARLNDVQFDVKAESGQIRTCRRRWITIIR